MEPAGAERHGAEKPKGVSEWERANQPPLPVELPDHRMLIAQKQRAIHQRDVRKGLRKITQLSL